MNKELKISADNALAAYNNTDANGRELLEHLFGKELFAQKDIKGQVKTFDDAVAILGIDNQSVIDYCAIACRTCTEDILAFAELRVIAEALNEGWKPKFNGDATRYYPWFYIYTEKGYDELDEDEKKKCRVVDCPSYYAFAYGGVVHADAGSRSTDSVSFIDCRLTFKTKELAEYCGKQFIDIWAKYIL